MTVTLRRVAAEERRPAFWDMLAAYLIEDAALDHDLPDDFDPLDFPNFEKYWIEEHRSPWWILHDGVPAGLALVARYAWSGEPVDHGLVEFYIAPEHRRQHVGETAANLLFDRFPGQWELATAHVSPRAQAFWRHTLAGRPGYREIERDKDRLHRFLGGGA